MRPRFVTYWAGAGSEEWERVEIVQIMPQDGSGDNKVKVRRRGNGYPQDISYVVIEESELHLVPHWLVWSRFFIRPAGFLYADACCNSETLYILDLCFSELDEATEHRFTSKIEVLLDSDEENGGGDVKISSIGLFVPAYTSKKTGYIYQPLSSHFVDGPLEIPTITPHHVPWI